MSLYYLILWNQVDILQKHFKKDHVHMRGRGFTVVLECAHMNLDFSFSFSSITRLQ